MKLIILAVCVASSLAAISPFRPPTGINAGPHHADLLGFGVRSRSQEIYPDGSYNWAYELDTGANAAEQGQPRAASGALAATGSFGWSSPEGEHISMTYVADENGYQPQGSHVHPIPAQIARALEWIAAHPYKEEEYVAKKKF